MARRRHRHAAAEIEPDDSVGLAGWLYTDLLLGLAVIFLGSIAVLIPAITDEEATAATTTTTTTTEVVETTTTLPVKLCTALYSPAEEAEKGIYIVMSRNGLPQTLADDFVTKLDQQLAEENDRPELVGQPLLRPGLRIGLVRAGGGTIGLDVPDPGQQGNTNAEELISVLREQLPEYFEGAVARYGFSNQLDESLVYLEILPLVEREC